jgi:hypothetical protein
MLLVGFYAAFVVFHKPTAAPLVQAPPAPVVAAAPVPTKQNLFDGTPEPIAVVPATKPVFVPPPPEPVGPFSSLARVKPYAIAPPRLGASSSAAVDKAIHHGVDFLLDQFDGDQLRLVQTQTGEDAHAIDALCVYSMPARRLLTRA